MASGKVLALDYGEKKVGVAISDSSRQLCFIRPYIANSGDVDALCKSVVDFCQSEGVAEVIVGLPLNSDGTLTDQAKKNMEFSERLDLCLEIPVHGVDESFSTFEASEIYKEANFPREKFEELKDSLSAFVVLKKYLK